MFVSTLKTFSESPVWKNTFESDIALLNIKLLTSVPDIVLAVRLEVFGGKVTSTGFNVG